MIMENPVLIDKFEVNVAVSKGLNWNKTAPQYFHFCRVQTPNNSHDKLIELLERLRISFPSPEYKLDVTGIPVQMFYGIDESKLVAGQIGYPA